MEIAQNGLQQVGLGLWRIDPPLRVSTYVSGLYVNGDIAAGGDGKLIAYGCRSGYHFLVTLLVKSPTMIQFLRNGKLYRRIKQRPPRPFGVWRGRIPTIEGTGPNAGTCTLDVRSSGYIGTTVFDVARG